MVLKNKKSLLSTRYSVRGTCNGQLLIESIIAISLVVVGMMAILAFLASALSLNRVVANQLTATYLAEEGIEIVKNIIDSNKGNGKLWNQGLKVNAPADYSPDYDDVVLDSGAFSVGPLLYDPATGYSYKGGGNETPFKRKVTLTPIRRGGTVNEYQVNSIVEWSNRSGKFKIDIEDHFYNWRQ